MTDQGVDGICILAYSEQFALSDRECGTLLGSWRARCGS
jgi:hypothetical protein